MTSSLIQIITKSFHLIAITYCFIWSNASFATSNADQQALPLISINLQSKIVFRPWETKGYGEQKPHDFITLITNKDLIGDLIILRWNDQRTEFKTEVYHQDHDSGILKSWESGTSGINKSIVQQPGGTLHIIKKVSGPDGGLQVEVIDLGTHQ